MNLILLLGKIPQFHLDIDEKLKMSTFSIFLVTLLTFVCFLPVPELFSKSLEKELKIHTISQFLLSQSIFESSKIQEAEELYNQAIDQYSKGEYKNAILSFQKALEIYRKIKDRKNESQVLSDLGGIYQKLRKNSEALEFNNRALKIRKEIGDELGELQSLINLGGTYNKLSQYALAVESFKNALVISNKIGTDRERSHIYSNLGQILANLGQFEQAFNYYNQAIKLRRQMGDRK